MRSAVGNFYYRPFAVLQISNLQQRAEGVSPVSTEQTVTVIVCSTAHALAVETVVVVRGFTPLHLRNTLWKTQKKKEGAQHRRALSNISCYRF